MNIETRYYPYQNDHKEVSTKVGTTTLTYSKSSKREMFVVKYTQRTHEYILPEDSKTIPMKYSIYLEALKKHFEGTDWQQLRVN